jgi:DNA-binding transcriptional MerR regulator
VGFEANLDDRFGRRAGRSRTDKELDSMALAAPTSTRPQIVDLDRPLYTIGIAADILTTHTRTLMMYEHLGLVVPSRTETNRRLYSQRDVITLAAIQRLTRGHGLNLVGARYVINCLQLLDAHRIPRPAALANVDIEHVKV